MPVRVANPVRDVVRAFLPLVAAILVSACVDTTAPDSHSMSSSMGQPGALFSEEGICGEDMVCVECPAEDHDPNSPCYTGPENPGEECIGPQCSYTNSVQFTSTAPDSALVGDTYSPVAVGEWENDGYPAIISSLTPDVCPLSSGIVTFAAPGTCTLAADQPGDLDVPPAAQVLQSFEVYSATWEFTGFFAPLANSPKPNAAKAGSAIPVKFHLGGDRGLEIFAVGSPYSELIECPLGGTIAAPVGARSRSHGLLSYDSTTGVYNFVWDTEKSWKNTCRRLTLALVDGSSHSVTVAFK